MSQTTQSGTPVKQSNDKRRPKLSHPKGVKTSAQKPRKASREQVVLEANKLLEDMDRAPLDEYVYQIVIQALWIYVDPNCRDEHSHSPRHAFGYVAGMAFARWEDRDLIAEAEEEFMQLIIDAQKMANKKTGIQPSRRELVAA